MALERIGLGGVLTFDATQAIRAMGMARDALGRFVSQSNQVPPVMSRVGQAVARVGQQLRTMAGGVGSGLNQMSAGLRGAGMALLPLSVGMAAGVGQVVNFERQMDAVGAVTLASAEEMVAMGAEARRLGATTVFTATQAGEAMELMGRSGANTQQILGGIGGVMSAASAESLDLATAADLVAQSTHISGREWEQAANTADVLALASARSNSSMVQLGEAMSYGGLQARAAGMDLEQTIALLGVLHDSGLRGSTAGTSLQNALLQLASPTNAAAGLLEEWGIQMTTTASGGLDLVDVVEQIRGHIDQLPTRMDQVAAANEIFGIRGGRAYFALANAGRERILGLEAELRAQSELAEGQGAAAEMSRRRLSNVAGQWTLFTSAVEGFFLAVFLPMMGPVAMAMEHVNGIIGMVTRGINLLIDAGNDAEARYTAMTTIMEENGLQVLQIVLGITDAMDDMQTVFHYVADTVQWLGEQMGLSMGGDMVRQITRVVVLFAVIGGALAPALLALGGIAFLVMGIVPLVTGLWEVIVAVGGAFSGPLLAAVGAVALAFMLFREDGEGVFDTLARGWRYVTNAAMALWDEALGPIWDGIVAELLPAFQEVGIVWDAVVAMLRAAVGDIVSAFSEGGSDITVNWSTVGHTIGQIILFAATIIAGAILMIVGIFRVLAAVLGFVIEIVITLGQAFINNIAQTFLTGWEILNMVIDGFQQLFSGDIQGGLMTIGEAILRFMVMPLQAVIRQIIGVADALGAADLVPDSVREFSRAVGSEQAIFGNAGGTGLMDSIGMRVMEGEINAGRPTASAAEQEMETLGRRVGDTAAARAQRDRATPEVAVDVQVEDAREIQVDNRVCMDGAEVARATARHQEEIGERAGFRSTPWERRVRVEQGAQRVRGG
jgi:TP901 family phage tail tape measure protein